MEDKPKDSDSIFKNQPGLLIILAVFLTGVLIISLEKKPLQKMEEEFTKQDT